MFAVPDLTVYAAATSPAAPSLTSLLRTVAALSNPVAGPVPVDDPRVRVWISVLHPGQHAATTYQARQGAFAVLDGAVEEHSGAAPSGDAPRPARPLGPGQVRAFGPGYSHEVHNTGTRPVHTLHIQIHP